MDYIKKTLKTAVFGIKYNKVFILLLLMACILLPFAANVLAFGVFLNMNMSISIALGVLLPLIMFSYVYKRTEFNFYCSMPVKRSQFFIGYCISAALIFIAVYLFGNAIGYYVDTEHQGYFWVGILMYMIAFASTTFAIMLSGSFLSTVVTFALTNIYVYVAVMEIFTCSSVYTGLYLNTAKPLLYMFTPFSAVESIYDSFGSRSNIWLTLIMAGVEMVLSFFLFCKRRSEHSAALAFPKMGLLYRYAAMFLAAVSVAGGFAWKWQQNIGAKSYDKFVSAFITSESMFYSVLTALVVFVAMNMVLENTPRAAFKRIRHYFIFIGGYSVFMLTVGGLLFSSLPYVMIPYKADMVLVNVYRYEETARFIYDQEYHEGDYSIFNGGYTVEKIDGAITVTDKNGTSFNPDYDALFEPKEGVEIYYGYSEEAEDKFDELQQEDPYSWESEYEYLGEMSVTRYYRKVPVGLYYTDDPSCIDMLSERVKQGVKSHIRGYSFELTNVLADDGYLSEDIYLHLSDLDEEGGLIAEIGFYKLTIPEDREMFLENPEKYLDSLGEREHLNREDQKIIYTVIRSEESLEEFLGYDVRDLGAVSVESTLHLN